MDRAARPGGHAATVRSFYVYNLQNQRAEKLGPLLTQAFTGRAPPASATPPPTVAPGTPAGTIVNPPQFQAQPSIVQPTINVTTTPAPGAQATAARGRARAARVSGSCATSRSSPTRTRTRC